MEDWSLLPNCHAWIVRNIPAGATILSLGSGEGDARLSAAGYHMVCVEHSLEWLGRYPSIAYIHAPLKWHKPIAGYDHCSWYDAEIVNKAIKNLDYAAIIMDGPPGAEGRSGFLKYIDMFKHNVPFIFDDLHRQAERKLANSVAARLNSPLVIYIESKHWGVVWKDKEIQWK